MIANIYMWIFLAALFAAAGLFYLTLALTDLAGHREKWSVRIVWFYILMSVSIGVLTVSPFFVDWSGIDWGSKQLLYGLFLLLIFYLCFLFKFLFSLPVILLLSFLVISLYSYFQKWTPVEPDIPAATFRIIARDGDGLKVELHRSGYPVIFSETNEPSLDITFKIMEIDRIFFFMSHFSYIKVVTDDKSDVPYEIINKFINWLEFKNYFISSSFYTVSIGDQPLLYEFAFLVDTGKEIYIERFK